MKTRVLLLSVISLFLISLFLTSCTSEEEKKPQIIIKNKTRKGKPGESISFNISIKSIYNISEISVSPEILGINKRVNIKTKKSIKNKKFTYNYIIPTNVSKKRIQITFRVKNKKRQSFAYAFVNIEKPIEKDKIIAFKKKRLASFDNLNIGSFTSFTNNETYLIEKAHKNSKIIDCAFFKGKKNGYTISAPNDNLAKKVYHNKLGLNNWKTQNATRFFKTKLSEADFNNIKDPQIIRSNSKKAQKSHISGIKNGTIVSFITADGIHGLAKINLVNSAKITIEVKIVESIK